MRFAWQRIETLVQRMHVFTHVVAKLFYVISKTFHVVAKARSESIDRVRQQPDLDLVHADERVYRLQLTSRGEAPDAQLEVFLS